MSKYESYIVGYYGMQNTGDDALLAATISGVKSFFGHKRILVSSNANAVSFDSSIEVSHLRSTPRFPGQNRLIHYANAIRSEQVVFGGGSVLHSARDLDLKRHLISLTANKKGYALGVGIETFKTPQDEKACIRFLNACEVVATRDNASFDLAKTIAPRANVVEAFDLAPMIAANHSLISSKKRSGVAINLCPLVTDAMGTRDKASEQNLIEALAQAIQHLWFQTNEPVTLISFNGHSVHGDDSLLVRLEHAIGHRVPVRFVAYDPNPFNALSLMKEFKVVIGMRLHCNVFAYLANTPSVSLHYHPKSEAWSNQVGVPQKYQINAFSCNARTILDALLSIVDSGESTASMPVESAVQKAQLNWEFAL